jgi:ABC-type glycerol-3-phosphate transport system permease component
MEYTWLIVLTVIVMVTAVVLTAKVASSLGTKEADTTYSIQTGRKWGRLISLYIVVIIVVLVIFLVLMNK